jgi:hypothetical protein
MMTAVEKGPIPFVIPKLPKKRTVKPIAKKAGKKKSAVKKKKAAKKAVKKTGKR